MYLLHAYYRFAKAWNHRYEDGEKRRKFDKTKSGAFKYWELKRCLDEKSCTSMMGQPNKTSSFLIGLRNEIEHHKSLDTIQNSQGVT